MNPIMINSMLTGVSQRAESARSGSAVAELTTKVCGGPQTKLPEELAVIRYCNEIGSAAHVELMRYAKPGMMEYQVSRQGTGSARGNPHHDPDSDLSTSPALKCRD